jgi:hypothetical protein
MNMLRFTFCALPGKIETYDPKLATASVNVMMRRVTNPAEMTIADYPKLVDVPVFQLTGGTGGVNVPVGAGDFCLVVFADRNIDNWFATGSAQPPNDSRTHSLSDGFALVGFRPLTDLVSRPDYLAASLYKDGTQVSVKGDKFAVRNPTTDLLTLVNAIISAVGSALSGARVDFVEGGPGTPHSVPLTYTFSPPDPSALLYQGDNTTPP